MECPGSLVASEVMADRPSSYAAEGTAAHELAAFCLTNGDDAIKYLGFCLDTHPHGSPVPFSDLKPDNVTVFEVDEEMVEAVQLYLDVVRSLIPKKGEYDLEVEQRLDMTHIHGEIFGTGDAVIYQHRGATLHVLDFKYGKGVAVEVDENPQLLLYGAGAAKRYHNRRIEKVVLHIVQPRAPHPSGSVRSWQTDPLSLMEFEDDIQVAATRAMEPDAPRFAGDWCRFCKALPVCPTARARSLKTAQQDFSSEAADPPKAGVVSEGGGASASAPPPPSLSPDVLATVLREAEFIGNWVKAVQAYAHSEAIEGRVPPGFKLVPKRASRRWKDEEQVCVDLMVNFDIKEETVYAPREVRSPAQIEKSIGKKAFAAIEKELVVKVSSGTNLVLETDVRPSVKVAATSDFDRSVEN